MRRPHSYASSYPCEAPYQKKFTCVCRCGAAWRAVDFQTAPRGCSALHCSVETNLYGRFCGKVRTRRKQTTAEKRKKNTCVAEYRLGSGCVAYATVVVVEGTVAGGGIGQEFRALLRCCTVNEERFR